MRALSKIEIMMSKLTLEEIGKLSGVSRATVSRVINNHPHIRDEVRERVLEVIETTGYQPNLAARSLASNESNIIGLVIPSIVNEVFTDPYFPRLTQGIAKACNDHGYTLSLFLFHSPAEEKMAARRIISNSLLDGVIITAAFDDPIVPDLVAANVRFVQVGRPHEPEKVNYVDVDNTLGGEIATKHLIELGYRRIAQIASLTTTAGIDRNIGYRKALHDSGVSIDEKLIAFSDFSRESGYDAMRELLPHHPDAVFIHSDSMSLGALQAIREAKLSVPDDIAIVGFDDLPPAELAEPALTTIRQPIFETGEEVVALLLDVLQHEPAPPMQVVLPVELVIRGSCGAVTE